MLPYSIERSRTILPLYFDRRYQALCESDPRAGIGWSSSDCGLATHDRISQDYLLQIPTQTVTGVATKRHLLES